MSAAHMKTQILDDQHTLCTAMDSYLFKLGMMKGTQKKYLIVVFPFYTNKKTRNIVSKNDGSMMTWTHKIEPGNAFQMKGALTKNE